MLWKLLLIVLALIIGLLYGTAHIALMQDRGWDYKNTIFITSFEAWDAEHYIAQIREIYEGNYWLSNAYIAEYKNTSLSKWPLFPLYLSAFLGKIFRIPPHLLPVVMDVVLPSVIFLLAYHFLQTISSMKSISLLGAFVFSTIPHIGRIELFPLIAFRIMSAGFSPSIFREAHCCYGFTRTINPQLTYIFLLASLFFFTKGMGTLKHKHFVFASIFGIFTSYSYVYFSTYLYVFLGIGAILSFLLKERAWFWRYLIVLGNILMFSIPFWWLVFRSSNAELSQMSWMLISHIPILNAQVGLMVILCTGVFFCLYKRYIMAMPGIVIFSLLISGVLCLNQHVFTGLYVQPNHYMLHTIPQATILAMTLLVTEIRREFSFRIISFYSCCVYGGIVFVFVGICLHPKIIASYLSSDGVLTLELTSLLNLLCWGGIASGICLIAAGKIFGDFKRLTKLLTGIKKSYYVPLKIIAVTGCISYIVWDVKTAQLWIYREHLLSQFAYFQQLSPALQWLNLHTEKESAVVCDPDSHSTSGLITIYTHNNVYVSEFSQYYAVPPLNELQERYQNVIYLMGMSSWQDIKPFIPSQLWDNFETYQKKLVKDVYTELKKYQADYLFYGPNEQRYFKVDPETTYPFLKKIYDDGIVEIYYIM
ncbi:MAG: hypothetical protein JXB49_28505 [Bacteroidales bacterium]|nr:hypothetical protein [Bacteroidales bacterium]